MTTAMLCLPLLFWMINSVSGTLSPTINISGGNITDILHHPHQVSVWSGSDFRGSGALVGDPWVVTTASLVTGFDANTLTVRSHSTSASSGGQLYNVSKVLIHPRFRFANMTNDVALLLLDKVVFTSMHRIKVTMARRPLRDNSTALISGWGSTSNRSKMSDHLREAWVHTVSRLLCQKAYNQERQIASSQFCAETVGAYGPCWGDNGDLLVRDKKLYGLLSWNRGCYTDVLPTVFTDISSVRRWIAWVMRRFQTQP